MQQTNKKEGTMLYSLRARLELLQNDNCIIYNIYFHIYVIELFLISRREKIKMQHKREENLRKSSVIFLFSI